MYGKCWGEVWERVLRYGGSNGRWGEMWGGGVKKCWVRCEKVCWGVGKAWKETGGGCGEVCCSVGEVGNMWWSGKACWGVERCGEVC